MKILLLGLANGKNKGTLALLNCIMDSVRSFNTDVEFIVNEPPGRNIKEYVPELKTSKRIFLLDFRRPWKMMLSFILLIESIIIYLIMDYKNVRISKDSPLFQYFDADLIINGGGDNLSGEYGIPVIANFINLAYAIFLKKPIVLYGMDFGYYKNKFINIIACFTLKKTNLILLREQISLEYIRDNSIDLNKVHLTADPAFLLEAVSKSEAIEILRNEGIAFIDRPLIGITPSPLIMRFTGDDYISSTKKNIDAIADSINYVINLLNANILLIPHVYGPSDSDDDRKMIDLIYGEIRDKSRVFRIDGEYTPQELKGIIGLCDIFIGARMHSTIASASMMVPTIGIAYSHKLYGILGKMLGQEKYVLDIKNLESDLLIEKIIDVWENRELIIDDLNRAIPEIKARARLNSTLVSEFINTIILSAPD